MPQCRRVPEIARACCLLSINVVSLARMPICVAGIHRSGTSMITRLLHCCGVSLGAADDLLPAAPDNPAGFWENRRFLAVNDMLLMALGGSWSAPPPFPPGWERATALDPLVAHA